jgi:hypothetical protein
MNSGALGFFVEGFLITTIAKPFENREIRSFHLWIGYSRIPISCVPKIVRDKPIDRISDGQMKKEENGCFNYSMVYMISERALFNVYELGYDAKRLQISHLLDASIINLK